MNYKQATEYIDNFYNFEKSISQNKSTLNLSRIKQLDKLYGHPHKEYPVIHIAGTKGKGSVACILSNILEEAGYKVGVYSSPHIFHIRERIRINDKDISTNDFTSMVTDFKSKMKKYPNKQQPTYFEILTEICFEYFKRQKVDIAIIETGLGGRYDATNIVKPVISVITPIGHDHQKQLGDTLESIASEKAGIIKNKGICITSNQKPSVNKILKEVCIKKKSALFNKNIKIPNIKVGLKGEHQKQNAVVALKAICVLMLKGFNVSEKEIKRGLQKAYLPGRFDIVSKNPNIILDAAHNKESAQALVKTYKKYFKKQAVLIFGILKDKNIKEVTAVLKPIISKVILVNMDAERAMPTEDLRQYFKGKDIFIEKNMKNAYNKAKILSPKKENILCAGSFYILGNFYKAHKRK